MHPSYDTRKQQDCMYFMRGTCTRGDECPFRHNPTMLARGPPATREDCFYFLQGRCTKGAQCPFAHDPVSQKSNGVIARCCQSCAPILTPLTLSAGKAGARSGSAGSTCAGRDITPGCTPARGVTGASPSAPAGGAACHSAEPRAGEAGDARAPAHSRARALPTARPGRARSSAAASSRASPAAAAARSAGCGTPV